jgi:hypothetical protein
MLVQEQELGEVVDFWPVVKTRLKSEPQPKTAASTGGLIRPTGRWAAAAVGVAVVAATSLWLYRENKRPEAHDPSEKLRINYISIEDQPARAYIYQTLDMDMTLVWVEKNGEGE